MNKETMRELRERAEEMISAGIANKDALFAALPESWRKQKLELSTSGINEAAPSDKELAKRGLAPKVKNVWSKTEEVVAGDC